MLEELVAQAVRVEHDDGMLISEPHARHEESSLEHREVHMSAIEGLD